MPQKRDKTKHRKRVLSPISVLSSWDRALRAGLNDDGGFDWTTLGTVSQSPRLVRAKIIAKGEGIWAADGLVEALGVIEPLIQISKKVFDGAFLRKGQVVCDWRGPSDRVLALERPFLNLASYVGGIALQTSELVLLVQESWKGKGGCPRVTATRKTLPGYRDLAICGVMAGGGHSHRVSLSGGILIKENHIAAAGSIEDAIRGVRAVAPHGLRVEIEVRNENELRRALREGVDVVLLDNFSPAQVRAATQVINKMIGADRVIVEVSGGLNKENIRDYAIEGVHVLSVGSLTHSVAAIDLSLLLEGT